MSEKAKNTPKSAEPTAVKTVEASTTTVKAEQVSKGPKMVKVRGLVTETCNFKGAIYKIVEGKTHEVPDYVAGLLNHGGVAAKL